MIENAPLISAEKLVYQCKKCSHKFNRMRYWSEYGYRDMECVVCHVTYFVNCSEDPIFREIQTLSKKKFSDYKIQASSDKISRAVWFENSFERTCDPCQCGGCLEFAKADMYLKCPVCRESHLKIVRTAKKYAVGEFKINWVTHNNFKAKGSV